MLLVAICAILPGADSRVAIQLWAEAKLDWLRRYVPLASGVPSHDTFGRVFAALDARQFEACFMRWVAPLCPVLHDQVVAIDGKTVRGSHHDGARAIQLVSAYGCGLGVVLGQQRTADHSNEITAIPALLDALLLKGAIVTIDAMGCQTQITRKIVQAQAHYVLAVKNNQSALAGLVRGVFAALERWPQLHAGTFDEYRECGKDHGRIETRRCVAQDISSAWPGRITARWAGLRSVVMI